jgi:hypothetical protein
MGKGFQFLGFGWLSPMVVYPSVRKLHTGVPIATVVLVLLVVQVLVLLLHNNNLVELDLLHVATLEAVVDERHLLDIGIGEVRVMERRHLCQCLMILSQGLASMHLRLKLTGQGRRWNLHILFISIKATQYCC